MAGKKVRSSATKDVQKIALDRVVEVVENERQRAVLFSHLARTVVSEFLGSDVGGPPLSITSPDGSVALARRVVVEEVAADLERAAARARGHMHRVLAVNVAVDVGARADDGGHDKVGEAAGGTVSNVPARSRG